MAKNNKVIFKAYSPTQGLLLPPSLDELIALFHPVRVVNEVIESVNLEVAPTRSAGVIYFGRRATKSSSTPVSARPLEK